MDIKIPAYSSTSGVRLEWEDGSVLSVHQSGSVTTVSGNHDGILSLARHLLSVAQARAPIGSHFHLDDGNTLEPGSTELIFEKV